MEWKYLMIWIKQRSWTGNLNLFLQETSELPNKGVHTLIWAITEEGVFNLLSTLNIFKACGPDLVNAIFFETNKFSNCPSYNQIIPDIFGLWWHSHWLGSGVCIIYFLKRWSKDSWELSSSVTYLYYLQTPWTHYIF